MNDMTQLSVVVMQLVGVLHMHGTYFYVPKSKGLLEILGRFMLVWGFFGQESWKNGAGLNKGSGSLESYLQVAAAGILLRDNCFPQLAFQKKSN